jgi:hypothetical protein
MAIQVNGTTVIDNSRNLSNVGGLKTVNGTSVLGSGDISAGGLETVLSTTTVSSAASSVILSWNNTGYEMIKIEIIAARPSVQGVQSSLRFSSNGGTSFASGGNDYKVSSWTHGNTSAGSNQQYAGTDNRITLSGSNPHWQGNYTSGYGGAEYYGTILLLNPGDSSRYTGFLSRGFAAGEQNFYMWEKMTSGYGAATNAITNAVQFNYISGNVNGGTFRVIGVKR